MIVYREEGTQKEEDLYDVIKVQLTKKSGKGIGLSIVGRKNGPGVFISDLVSLSLLKFDFFRATISLYSLLRFLEELPKVTGD